MMEICDDGVIVQKDGEEQKVPCDTVVFAAGYRADHSLYEAILDAGYDCVQVGDNVRPGKIIDAISQGYNYIRVLE
jgi:NADH dehydrogenase FAD-containing subunit